MKILIALDASPVASRAAREAHRLFSPAGADFLVINVAATPIPWLGMNGYGAIAPMTADPRWFEPDETAAAELSARAAAAGVPDPQAVVSSGDPVHLICAAADEHDVDVIVVGSHDKTALRRLVDPSVAAGVVRETYRPVLVVSGEPPTDR